MATAAELLDAVEALVDELEGDLGLAAGVNIPREPLPTIKQMMVVLEPRLRAIAAAVPAGGVEAPAIDFGAVLKPLDEIDAGLGLLLERVNAMSEVLGDAYRGVTVVNDGVDALLVRVAAPPAPELPPESADGTESPPATHLVDAAGVTWALVRPYDLIVYKTHQVYVRDGEAWFAWSNGAWVPSSDPRGTSPPPQPPPPPPPLNRDPVWPPGETRLEFTSGQAKDIRLADFASDLDGDALRLFYKGGTLAPGFVYDEASDELRYDGRPLPAGNYGVFTVAADDGRT